MREKTGKASPEVAGTWETLEKCPVQWALCSEDNWGNYLVDWDHWTKELGKSGPI